jgi:broad specificity phosphatase PhoE
MAKSNAPLNQKPTGTLVFVRHAHRDKPVPDQDNGLSSKGQEQVKDLINAFKKGKLPNASHFWTSPKKRCAETLGPLAETAKANLLIEDLLDEQKRSEDSKQFQKRIEKLLEKAKALHDVVYLCSHGDLIPEAIDLLTGTHVDLYKGEAVIVENDNGEWSLQ